MDERAAVIDGARHALAWDGRVWRSKCFGKTTEAEPEPPADDDESPDCPRCFPPP